MKIQQSIRRRTPVVLALCLALTAWLAACDKNEPSNETTKSTISETTEDEEMRAKGYEYNIDELDYRLVWSDEFDRDGQPDPAKWGYDTGGTGWGNNELQNYTETSADASSGNAVVKDGRLIIEARREQSANMNYSSARLVSKGKADFLYGKFEFRAKLPEGRGTWPAIWMLPTDWQYGNWPRSGEIDIMEHVGYDQDVIVGTIHTEAYNHTKNTQKGKSIKVDGVSEDYHVYTMEWLPDRIRWFVDSELYNEFNPTNYKVSPGIDEWPFDEPFHILMNIAVGGNWGGAEGVDESIWPQTMEIDYVRVYQSPVIHDITDQGELGYSSDIKQKTVLEEPIRGVNIGSWLLLERWMVPELFRENNSSSNDEYHFMLDLGDRKEAVMKEHYETFFTEDDFIWLAEHGINTLRIPVGFWVLDGKDHYVAAASYLDWAFKMAEKYEIKILIDLHGVRDSQNGFDNSGLEGNVGWHKKEENITEAVEVIGQLAERYHDETALFGIQLLNEPSWEIPLDVLQDYYTRAYEAAMQYLDADLHYVVIHDGFRLNQWKNYMQDAKYENVILDTHLYHVFEEEDNSLDLLEQVQKAAGKRREAIEEMTPYFPVVVGEWSLGIHSWVLNELGEDYLSQAAMMAFGTTQMVNYGQDAGWFFWSYKLSEEGTRNMGGWSFRTAVEKGWLPQQYK